MLNERDKIRLGRVVPNIKVQAKTLEAGKQAEAVRLDSSSYDTPVIEFGIPQGIQGERGETGQQGIQGETGPQGIQGERGMQGIQGEMGQQGVQGATGPQGIQGERGERGEKGEQGPEGTLANLPTNLARTEWVQQHFATAAQGVRADNAMTQAQGDARYVRTNGNGLTAGIIAPNSRSDLHSVVVRGLTDCRGNMVAPTVSVGGGARPAGHVLSVGNANAGSLMLHANASVDTRVNASQPQHVVQVIENDNAAWLGHVADLSAIGQWTGGAITDANRRIHAAEIRVRGQEVATRTEIPRFVFSNGVLNITT